MRYQTHRYIVRWETVEPFVPGDPSITVRHRETVPGRIIWATDRRAALARARDLYGADSAGVSALDVDCQWCEDRPVRDAAEWLDGIERPPAPCPRCGVTHD